MKLGQGGQYITQRYLEMKNTLLGMRGGLLGDLKFLLRGKWTADLSHDWAWIKNLLGWPQGGTKTFPKSTQKFLDPALIWSSRAPQSFFWTCFQHVPVELPDIVIVLKGSKYAQNSPNFMIKMLVCWVTIKFGWKLSRQFLGIFSLNFVLFYGNFLTYYGVWALKIYGF